MRQNLLTLFAVAVFQAPAVSAQSGTDDVEGIGDNFPDAIELGPISPGIGEMQPPSDDSGSGLLPGLRVGLKHEIASRFEDPEGLVNNRSSVRLEYKKYVFDDFYLNLDVIQTAFWSRDHRSGARDADVFSESTVRQAYLQYSKGSTTVTLGNQIPIWGVSDAGAITDVIAPRELNELFFISLERSRISQFMLAVDQYSDVGHWEFFYVPEPRFNDSPDLGTAYYKDPFNGSAEFLVEEENLDEFGLRWKKTFGNNDISLMAARLLDNDRAIYQDGFSGNNKLLIKSKPQRLDMVGATFDYVTGRSIFSGEIAMKSPKAFLNSDTLQIVRKDTIDTSLRMEYGLGNGGNHSLSLEAVNNHVLDWDNAVSPTPRDESFLVIGWNNSFLNETLSASWVGVYNLTFTSFQNSLFLSYDLNDSVTLSLDAFHLNVSDRDNGLYPYDGENTAIFRILYQF